MLKNNGKTAIGRNFLLAICVICLMFTAFGLFAENSFAADLNDTSDDVGLESNSEIKLGNSQLENDDLEVNSQNSSEKLANEYELGDMTFADIQTVVNNADPGDTIKLNGKYYYSTGSQIDINKCLTIIGTSSTVMDAKNLSYMFNIQSDGAGTVIKNIKFINGINTQGSAVYVGAKDVFIDNCAFENNHCTESGGAVFTTYDLDIARRFKITNCNFTNNNAYRENYEEFSCAAALGVYGIDSQVINCIFDSNWVRGTHPSFGGAIQAGLDLPGSNVKVIGCTFKNNAAYATEGSHGGAGCIRNGTQYINCIFINNTADEGGALTFHASGAIVNCTFIENTANNYGGALSTGFLYDNMVLNILNCTFDGNTAPLGGAIQAKGEYVNILNSTFNQNSVTEYGGAINVEAKDVTIDDSIFSSNIANIDGGAVYIHGENTIVENSEFISNEAIPDVSKLDDGLGGAIYINSTQATINNNYFMYNTARNGSAIYYDYSGEKLTLNNNTLYQNQAWSYKLPISAENIYYGDSERITVVLHGGNNIADFDNLAVSNAIYNAATNTKLVLDGESPVYGATNSGELYQDDREYNMNVLLTIQHEDGTLVYNEMSHTSYLGEIIVDLDDLKPGKYYVSAKHYEDTYYKEIENETYFIVYPKVDNQITITTTDVSFNFEDIVVWTLNITNNGPNNSTGVIVSNIIPDGLIWIDDTSRGKYHPNNGTLDIGDLDVGENLVFNITTIVNKTGEIVNEANITANELDINMANNYDEAVIYVNPASDLAVVKKASSQYPNYLDTVVWTIEVTNNGPDTAHNVVVYDILPKSLIYKGNDGNYDNESGIWYIGTLDVGEKATLTVTCIVNSTGMIENNVSVNGSEYDYDLTNNNDSERIFVNPSADLSIIKSVNASEVNYLDLVTWTLVISNNGPDNATCVKVEDFLPDGFVYINSTLTKGNYTDGVFLIGDVEVGEIIIIELITKVENTGEFVNIANVTGNEYDYNMANNEDNESILVNPASDLLVTKEVDESNPKYGDYVSWTITVYNNGPDTATEVIAYDLLPKSLIWISDDSEGDYNPVTGEWNIGELDFDDSVTLTIECLVNGTGEIQNNVSVSAKEYDYNLTNNYANETIDVEKSADVSVVKSVNNTAPNYMDLVTWTLTITNNGPDKATNVYVEDTLPEGLILISYTATKGFYDADKWVMCCLNKGEVETLEMICLVNKTGEITNIATIYADEHDSNLTNNVDNETINVPLAVDVQVIIEVNNTSPLFGENITWIISVKNNGPDNATEVVLYDILPDELIYNYYDSSKGIFADNTWLIGQLNVGDEEYLNISTVANSLGEIIDEANVESKEYDWNMTNNYDNSTINVKPVADLSVIKSVSNSNPNYGNTITWTLVAYNNGPNNASNVKVYDNLPEGLKLISATGNYANGVWNIGNLNAGESRQLQITCKVTSTGNIINTANIEGDEYDPDMDNNYDEEDIVVPPASDLEVTKVASKYKYVVGDVVSYVIEIVNNGPDTAYNIKADEILDDLLKLKSFKVTKGKFNKDTGVWTISSLAYGESAKLYIKAIAAGSGILKNTVSVTSDSFDYDMSNNKDYAIVKVSKKVSKNISKVHKSSKLISNGNNKVNLLENPTANPFAVLIISIAFSIIFSGENIRKKR